MERVLINPTRNFLKLQFLSHSSHNRNLKPFSISCGRCLDQKWRKERKLVADPNSAGVLTDKQDYSFLDGRPVPLGSGVKRRVMKQREYAETIVRLSKEIDFAVERYDTMLKEEKEARQRKLDSKLKPKGHHLLKSK